MVATVKAVERVVNARSAAEFIAALEVCGSYPYFHMAHVWVMQKLTAEQMEALSANSDYLRIYKHGEIARDKDGQFVKQVNCWPYAYEVHICKANNLALAVFAALDNHARFPTKLIYIEIALDLILATQEDADRLCSALPSSFVQFRNGKKHKDHQPKLFASGGFSTGRRSRGKYTTGYPTVSYLTGELFCVHIEVRLTSARAIRDVARITSPADLLTFDFLAFWQKNFILRQLDIARLGRFVLNKAEGKKRQKAERRDIRTGAILSRAVGLRGWHHFDQRELSEDDYEAGNGTGDICVQLIVDRFGAGPFLKPIPIAHLLPETGQNAMNT